MIGSPTPKHWITKCVLNIQSAKQPVMDVACEKKQTDLFQHMISDSWLSELINWAAYKKICIIN